VKSAPKKRNLNGFPFLCKKGKNWSGYFGGSGADGLFVVIMRLLMLCYRRRKVTRKKRRQMLESSVAMVISWQLPTLLTDTCTMITLCHLCANGLVVIVVVCRISRTLHILR